MGKTCNNFTESSKRTIRENGAARYNAKFMQKTFFQKLLCHVQMTYYSDDAALQRLDIGWSHLVSQGLDMYGNVTWLLPFKTAFRFVKPQHLLYILPEFFFFRWVSMFINLS